MSTDPIASQNERVDWVDYAKGICIILVVMMHVVYGVEHVLDGQGWMHSVVDFARPFRMPRSPSKAMMACIWRPWSWTKAFAA